MRHACRDLYFHVKMTPMTYDPHLIELLKIVDNSMNQPPHHPRLLYPE